MEAKLFDVRDRGTRLAVIAVRLAPDNEDERALLEREGFSSAPEKQGGYILAAPLLSQPVTITYDPFHWRDENVGRTMELAHKWIADKWSELDSGAVLDIAEWHL